MRSLAAVDGAGEGAAFAAKPTSGSPRSVTAKAEVLTQTKDWSSAKAATAHVLWGWLTCSRQRSSLGRPSAPG